jgi:hypothetical protein
VPLINNQVRLGTSQTYRRDKAGSAFEGTPSVGWEPPKDRPCEGLRMPADAKVVAGSLADVRKPPRKEPAGKKRHGL